MKITTPILLLGAGLLTLALFHSAGQSLTVKMVDGPRQKGFQAEIDAQQARETFETKEELREWAQTSTFGGGRIEELELADGKRVIVAYRTYTSGIESSDVSVFVPHAARGWQLVVYRQPLYRDFIDVMEKEDRLVFQTRKGEQTLLELPFDGLVPVTTRAGLREIEMLSLFQDR